MKSILKATAILGSSSVVSVATGLVSSKVLASMIGPAGIGYLSALQAFLSLAVMVAGLGVGTAAVRTIAKAKANGEHKVLVITIQTVIMASYGLGLSAFLVIIVARQYFNQLIFDDGADSLEIGILGGTVILVLLSNCYVGIVNAFHEIKALAKIAILNNITNATCLVGFVLLYHRNGLIYGIVTSSLVNLLVAHYFFKLTVGKLQLGASFREVRNSSISLLKFGLPYTASMIVGGGVQAMIPVLLIHMLSFDDVGFFRAASAISVTSLGLVLGALGQDYYPRLSMVSESPEKISRIVNDQLYFVLIAFSPILLWLMALSSPVVRLLYTPQFSVSAGLLKIMLAGDVLKLLSWLFAFVLLTRNRSGLFFLGELTAGILMIGATYVGVRLMGLNGAAMGYGLAYLGYCVVLWFFIRNEVHLVLGSLNKALLAGLLFSVGVIYALSTGQAGIFGIYMGYVLCSIITIFSIIMLFKEYGAADEIPAEPTV